MSDEELDAIRRRKMMEMQQQAAQDQQEEAMMQQYEAQKQLLLRKILSPEARQRLANIKMARPDFANAIESQLVQLAQSGQINRLGIQLPMSDEDLKTILVQISSKQKRDFNIKRM